MCDSCLLRYFNLSTCKLFIRKQDQILVNKYAGYFVKSKQMGCNEGGLAIGIGAHDTICLVSQDEYLQSAILPSRTKTMNVRTW